MLFRSLVTAVLSGLAVVGAAAAERADSLQMLQNPERGFYRTSGLRLKAAGNAPAALAGGPLVHLRVDISAFSAAAGGADAPLSADALAALDKTLAAVRAAGKGVIIRSCYDPGFSGKKNTEPPQKLLLQHLRQMGAVYSRYEDVIVCLELGTFGPWGEMHSSTCCTKENVNEALDTLLAAVPPTLTVNVRTPQYVAGWLGLREPQTLDGASPAYTAAMKSKGRNALRVGMFNDGYLGSSSDLGTFAAVPRAAGVAWLNQAGTRTFYGGEVVADAGGAVQGAFNTVSFLSGEAPVTHTTYLNFEWNQRVHRAWETDTYHCQGSEYDGQDGLKYVTDHLGYRLVLRGAKVNRKALADKRLKLELCLENVGFAPVIKPKEAEIVLTHEDGTTTCALPWKKLDIRTLGAGEKKVFHFSAPLTQSLKRGRWTAHLRLRCPGYATAPHPPCIRLADTPEAWNEQAGTNELCTFRCP